jgi:pyrroline-5-carboxylate reductase
LSAVTKLQMIGGGKMGQALLGGMIQAKWIEPSDASVVEVSADQRDRLVSILPGVQVLDAPLPGVPAVVAVKPHFVLEVARSLEAPGLVVSIAAGITIAAMEQALPPGTRVLRVMPNTPALVGVGAAAIAAGTHATDDDLAWTLSMFDSVGAAVTVTEPQLDAVTGLSGSGPAYVFLVAEAMADAGVAAGLPRPVAELLAHQTVRGAGTMLTDTGSSATDLRIGVTTPAGTTAAGLRVLEERAIRSAIIDAVQAAADRSREMGES